MGRAELPDTHTAIRRFTLTVFLIWQTSNLNRQHETKTVKLLGPKQGIGRLHSNDFFSLGSHTIPRATQTTARMGRFDPTWPQHWPDMGSISASSETPTSAQLGSKMAQLSPNLRPKLKSTWLQKVSDSLAHTKLNQLYTQNFGSVIHTKLTQLYTHNRGGWGGAREDKGRIYQPDPSLNFISLTSLKRHNRYSTFFDLPSHFIVTITFTIPSTIVIIIIIITTTIIIIITLIIIVIITIIITIIIIIIITPSSSLSSSSSSTSSSSSSPSSPSPSPSSSSSSQRGPPKT